MILEELVDKLTQRLTCLERALKEKGILDEADISGVIASEAWQSLPAELGERIRKLNEPDTLDKMCQKTKNRPHPIMLEVEQLKNKITKLEEVKEK